MQLAHITHTVHTSHTHTQSHAYTIYISLHTDRSLVCTLYLQGLVENVDLSAADAVMGGDKLLELSLGVPWQVCLPWMHVCFPWHLAHNACVWKQCPSATLPLVACVLMPCLSLNTLPFMEGVASLSEACKSTSSEELDASYDAVF